MSVHFLWTGVPESDEGSAVFTIAGERSQPIQFHRMSDMVAVAELLRGQLNNAEERGRQRGLAEVQALLERRQRVPHVPMPSPGRIS